MPGSGSLSVPSRSNSTRSCGADIPCAIENSTVQQAPKNGPDTVPQHRKDQRARIERGGRSRFRSACSAIAAIEARLKIASESFGHSRRDLLDDCRPAELRERAGQRVADLDVDA